MTGVMMIMKRPHVVLAFALLTPLAAIATFVVIQSQPISVSLPAIAPKSIPVPHGWDNACARNLRAAQQDGHPSLSQSPLSADEIAIYRAVLHAWNEGSQETLNVSDRSIPLRGSFLRDCKCVEGLEANAIATAAQTRHKLTREALPQENIRLVDRGARHELASQNDPGKLIRQGKAVEEAVEAGITAGVLSLSEIAFDREHRLAVIGFSFYCGALCGRGGVFKFEKINEVWKKKDDTCGGGWIS